MEESAQSLSLTKSECKFHVVWIAKCWQKVLYGRLRQRFGYLLKDLVKQPGYKILEGQLRPDHIHILISLHTQNLWVTAGSCSFSSVWNPNNMIAIAYIIAGKLNFKSLCTAPK